MAICLRGLKPQQASIWRAEVWDEIAGALKALWYHHGQWYTNLYLPGRALEKLDSPAAHRRILDLPGLNVWEVLTWILGSGECTRKISPRCTTDGHLETQVDMRMIWPQKWTMNGTGKCSVVF